MFHIQLRVSVLTNDRNQTSKIFPQKPKHMFQRQGVFTQKYPPYGQKFLEIWLLYKVPLFWESFTARFWHVALVVCVVHYRDQMLMWSKEGLMSGHLFHFSIHTSCLHVCVWEHRREIIMGQHRRTLCLNVCY